MTLSERWQMLRDQRLREGEPRLRLPTSPSTDAYAALRLPEDHVKLLIGLGREAPPLKPFDSDAIKAGSQTLDGVTHAAIELLDSAHEDLFAALCSDILRRIDGLDVEEARDIVVVRLERWRDMLRSRRRGLTMAEQRGLAAELRVLQELMTRGLPVSIVIDAWEGPGGGLHDLRLPGASVEVKAPGSAEDVLRINGVAQLHPAEPGEDLLLAVCLVTSHADGQPLAGIIEDLRRAVDSAVSARQQLEQGLLMMGWADADADRYPTQWKVARPLFHAVVAGFPRLEADAIPDGVQVGRFSLSQRAIKDYEITEDAAVRLLLSTIGDDSG